jgi:YegS/Rv2252/BmrU family lipid kinase
MYYLIVNPMAGNVRDEAYWLAELQQVGIQAMLCNETDWHLLPNLGCDDFLLVAGGDGTIRRYAPWCAKQGCILGVLPGGTANDFARSLGIPLNPRAACLSLAEGKPCKVDLGWVDEEVFLNVAHAGLGSEVSPCIDPAIKQRWGRLSYFRTLLDRLNRRRGFVALIECDGVVKRGRWLEIAVANGSFFGSGQRIYEASLCDGQLDVLAVRPKSLYLLLGVWLMAWLQGATPRHDAIVQMRGTDCKITHCRRRLVSADGESVARLPTRFRIQPAALRVIVPSNSKTLCPVETIDESEMR